MDDMDKGKILLVHFHVGNEGMILSMTKKIMIPASPSNPSIPYVKRTSK